MSKVRFQIIPPIGRPEETVWISGNVPSLGEWQDARALRLEWKPPFHVGEIEADTGAHIEYKVRRDSWETESVDAYGNVPANFTHDVWLDATLHRTVADWKDRYRGRLTRERLASRVLAGGRDLLIWLPQSYATEPKRRFPLVVLSDGNNIFDPLTSPLSGVDWAADEWITRLSGEGVLPEAIVVGVCHPEGFSEENEPLREHDLSPQLGGLAYADFVTNDLVNHLDTHYRTLASPSARILGGSSLGALLAFHVAIHRPGVFGKFACLSTSFEDVSQSLPDQSGQLQALANLSALPRDMRMFFDYGTQGLDECYEPYHQELGALLRAKGWTDDREFQIRRVDGGAHNELSWRQRFGDALRFLAR